MPLSDLLARDRSYRGFRQTPRPSYEQLCHLAALTRLCPSSGNVQPLKYRPVCDDQTNALILSLTRWAGRMKTPKLPREGMAPTAYLVVLHDVDVSPNPVAFYKDVGIAAHTMLLGAVEMGFGGCMLGGFSAERLSEALALPQHLKPVLVIALGAPAERIVLEDAPVGFVDRDHAYYRDAEDVHHVWKRTLEELIV